MNDFKESLKAGQYTVGDVEDLYRWAQNKLKESEKKEKEEKGEDR